MTAVQTTYLGSLVAGKAGEIASMSPSKVDSKLCQQTAGIGFGLAVCEGSEDRGVVLAQSVSPHGAFVGITVRDVTLPPSLSSGTADIYPLDSNVGVLVEGDIWVDLAGDVLAGKVAHFNATTGAISGAGGVTIAGSRFMTSGSSGGVAILRLTRVADGA